MNTLLWFVILYWIFSVGIGIYAARFVRNSSDFAVAGRSLPIYIVTATIFATWFGSEAILGIPAVFIEEGFRGVVADPFGAALCLILVGLVFSRRLYRMNLLTISDFFRIRYGRLVEILVTLCILASYLGWVAAQIKALGLVFNVVSGGYISMEAGMIIGACSVLIYTLLGGMWSVAISDFVQMSVIVVGLLYITWVISGMAGGAHVVIQHASSAGKLNILPKAEMRDILWFTAALITMMLGSMPQQDVFQRIASSRSETVARNSAVLGGMLYFLMAMIPMFLCYSAMLIDPAMVDNLMEQDSQLILPSLIMAKMPVFAQIMFFGALLSAIKSCASATLLAPSVTFSENILKGFLPPMSDRQSLALMRVVVLCFSIFVTVFALSTDASIFEMVQNAYRVTLVAAFVPFFAGFFWKRANSRGALLSVVSGLVFWAGMELFIPDGFIPPQLLGFVVAIIAMIAGSLWSGSVAESVKDADGTRS